jgi:hypothetical protein
MCGYHDMQVLQPLHETGVCIALDQPLLAPQMNLGKKEERAKKGMHQSCRYKFGNEVLNRAQTAFCVRFTAGV